MHCKVCNYALWNIAPGPCPECGAVFKPSNYTLNANTCQFICPHPGCRQDYYGTDEHGHLVPRAFVCVKCRQPVEMDQMLILPTRGVDERLTQKHRNPWVERGGRGWVRAYLATFSLALAPVQLGRAAAQHPPQPGVAVVFATLTCLLLGAIGFGVLAFAFVPMMTVGRMGIQATGQDWLWTVGYVVLWLLGPGAVMLLSLLVWGVLTQTCMQIFGRLSGRPPGEGLPLARTVELMCYASPSLLLIGVPCAGFYLTPLAVIWLWIAAGFMIAEHNGRRLAEALISMACVPVLILIVVLALYALV